MQATDRMRGLARELAVISKALDSGFFELEALFFPGISEAGDGRFPSERVLARKAKDALDELDLHQLHQRATPPVIQTWAAEVSVSPKKRTPSWREPVNLRFDVLEWRQAEAAWVAYVPALGIEVVARDQEKLRALAPQHIQAALVRQDALKSIGNLIPLGRWQGISVSRARLNWQPRTPKEIEKETEEQQSSKDDVLRESATQLDPSSQPQAFEVDEAVEKLARELSGLEGRSVLLVGAAGTGKTSVFRECIRRSSAAGLAKHEAWMTTGSRLAAGMSGFGMWQERCAAICKTLREKPSILHVGNLLELIQVGKSEHNKQGIAAFLRPYIERRDIQVVAECTPEQLAIIETTDPRLIDVFSQIRIEEPDFVTGGRILARWAEWNNARSPRGFTPDAIDAADRLHRRFGGYSPFPGRPLRFLRNLSETLEREGEISKELIFRGFTRETGLPAFLVDETIPMDLSQARAWFSERLLGQSAAVDLVVDVLAIAKARMARPRKPLASLIFIGPTGIGKTQMAKCLAEFMFGDPHRLIRLDMSEFSDEMAVKRLAGEAGGREGLLTSRVREQPFSIVLFDEFEKADPLFYDLLLQVLGEGRLTDAAGRTADFTNSVVIMTSNLGAFSYSKAPAGFVQRRVDADEHFTEALQKFVRPELFNRIDAVVPFSPLDSDAILEVARRELSLIKRRDGVLGRQLHLTLEKETISWLAEKGFDEKYGARPLKRALQEHLLAPLAEGINGYDGALLLAASASVADDRLRVGVKPLLDAQGQPIRLNASGGAAEALALACGFIRREIRRLKQGAAYTSVCNLAYRLRRFAARGRTDPKQREAAPNTRWKLKDLESVLAETDEFEKKVCETEDAHLLHIYGHGQAPAATIGSLQVAWREILLKYWEMAWPHPTGRACLAVYGRHLDLLCDIVLAYTKAAQWKGAKVHCLALEPSAPKSPGGRPIKRTPIKRMEDLSGFKRLVGVVVELNGPMVHPCFAQESGKHAFIHQDKQEKRSRFFLVDVVPVGLDEYQPPTGVESPKVVEEGHTVRKYDAIKGQVRDDRFGHASLDEQNLSRTIQAILDQVREKALKDLVNE